MYTNKILATSNNVHKIRFSCKHGSLTFDTAHFCSGEFSAGRQNDGSVVRDMSTSETQDIGMVPRKL